MKLVVKNELEPKIGKTSFWMPKQVVGSCEYIAGIEGVDQLIDSDSFFHVKPLVNFKVHANGLAISLMYKFKLHYLALRKEEIKSISLEKGDVIDREGRSVVGRAIVGGLLLGPLGAVIGGVSGVKDKIIKDNDSLVIIVENGGKEQAILFTIKKGKAKDVLKFFSTYYNGIFSIAK